MTRVTCPRCQRSFDASAPTACPSCGLRVANPEPLAPGRPAPVRPARWTDTPMAARKRRAYRGVTVVGCVLLGIGYAVAAVAAALEDVGLALGAAVGILAGLWAVRRTAAAISSTHRSLNLAAMALVVLSYLLLRVKAAMVYVSSGQAAPLGTLKGAWLVGTAQEATLGLAAVAALWSLGRRPERVLTLAAAAGGLVLNVALFALLDGVVSGAVDLEGADALARITGIVEFAPVAIVALMAGALLRLRFPTPR